MYDTSTVLLFCKMKISRSSKMTAKKPTATQSPLIRVCLGLSDGPAACVGAACVGAACDGAGGAASAGGSVTGTGCSGVALGTPALGTPALDSSPVGGGASSPIAGRGKGADVGVGIGCSVLI
jgi:hypothetical protein